MDPQLWEVVADGGLVVRAGKDLVSAKEQQKLAKGAVVREKALVKDRLNYELVAGAGPANGWVSLKSAATGKPALVRTSVVPSGSAVEASTGVEEAGVTEVRTSVAEASTVPTSVEKEPPSSGPAADVEPAPSIEPTASLDVRLLQVRDDIPPVTDRPMRVLGLHGAPGNGNLTKYQTTQLRRVLGPGAEWLFVDAPRPWQPEPRGQEDKWQHVTRERTDMELRIADGRPFTQWYDIDLSGEVEEPPNRLVPEACEYLLNYIDANAPVDIAVAFSNGASTLFALLLLLRRRGRPPPWRLNVFFCGSPPPPEAGEPAPITQPTVEVLGGEGDSWAALAWGFSSAWCTELVVLQHEDGHQFPATEPRANEIYTWLAAEMRRHCGLAAPGDEELRRPPVPREVEVVVRHALPELESAITITVLDNCRVSAVKQAVLRALDESRASEVRLVKRQGLSFTALEGEEPIGDRREFLALGRSLAVQSAAPQTPAVPAGTQSPAEPARAPAVPQTPAGKPRWRVVGGAQTGGIRVKDSEDLISLELPKKLVTGSIVEEIARGGIENERVRYVLLHGEGPKVGWVSQWVKDKPLLEPYTE